MARKKLNGRCPLQAECERKCEHEGHELDCDYYSANAFGDDRTIPDQEERRSKLERERDAEDLERALAEIDDEDDADGQPVVADASQITYLPISELVPHPDNPRKDLGDLTELADSIKANGILQNLTVVPNMVEGEISHETWQRGYKVVIGHRRLAAAKLAGLKELPCIVKEMSLREQVRTMLMENIHRADLSLYEQAQGFQMMLDLGDAVEDVARKSGFSQTTIRRRMKLLELDQNKFKASVERGASITDYMELDKIKDVKLKNEVLEAIGTENFKYKLRSAIDKEKQREKLAALEAVVSRFATKVDSEDDYKYMNGYSVGCTKPEDIKVPDDAGEVEYFYFVTNYGYIRLMTKRERAPEDEAAKQAAQLRAERLEARRNGLEEATARAYKLRSDFAEEVSNATARKCLADIVALWIHGEYWDNTDWMDGDDIDRILGIEAEQDVDAEDEDGEASFTVETAYGLIAATPEKMLWRMVHLRLSDGEGNGYYQRYSAKHCENEALDALYSVLEKLGYEMSDDEKALQDGTHELFLENGGKEG